jgi:hypothetical protein
MMTTAQAAEEICFIKIPVLLVLQWFQRPIHMKGSEARARRGH